MCGGQAEAIFSSDSEGEQQDEREDYTRLAHKVNPITGRVEKVYNFFFKLKSWHFKYAGSKIEL